MKNINFTKAITFTVFIASCLISCKKSSSVDNDPNNGNTSTIFHDNNLTLVDIYGNITSPSAGGYYDIFGNGTAYVAIGGSVSLFSFQGSAGNSSFVSGSGPDGVALNNTYSGIDNTFAQDHPYFNHLDVSLSVEILDTTITHKCDFDYTFAKFYPLGSYSQSIFSLPPASYSNNFVYSCNLSLFNYSPNYSCGSPYFTQSPFANGGYFIFRVRNIKTNKSNYGWIRVMVSSGNNFVSPIGFSEIAYSKTQDVLLAPGYYK